MIKRDRKHKVIENTNDIASWLLYSDGKMVGRIIHIRFSRPTRWQYTRGYGEKSKVKEINEKDAKRKLRHHGVNMSELQTALIKIENRLIELEKAHG